MHRFQTAREAKEYLISRILEQADRDGTSLSDVERKMLYFSETGWTLPGMMSVSHEFDKNYDQDEYERKIGQIIRRVRGGADGNRDEWNDAVRRLREEDHYLLVLIDGASRGPTKTSRWDFLKLILASVAVVAVALPANFWIHSHIENEAIQRCLGMGTLFGAAVLATLLATRGR